MDCAKGLRVYAGNSLADLMHGHVRASLPLPTILIEWKANAKNYAGSTPQPNRVTEEFFAESREIKHLLTQ